MEESRVPKYNINYYYTSFLALLMNKKYNKSNVIDINILKDYPKLLIQISNETESKSHILTMLVEHDNFEKFLEDNKDIIRVEEDKVILNERVSTNDLHNILNKFNFPFTDSLIYIIAEDPSLRKVLNLHGINDILCDLEKVEALIEDYYTSYAYNIENIDDKKRLDKLLQVRNSFYSTLLRTSRENLEDFYNESLIFSRNDSFETTLPIDSGLNNEKFNDEEIEEINYLLTDVYMYAIFDDLNNPTRSRIYEDINNLCLRYSYFNDAENESEYRENVNRTLIDVTRKNNQFVYTSRGKTELLLYLKFIRCIDEILYKYGFNENLVLMKFRLIYLLDDVSLNLLKRGNIDELIDKLTHEYEDTKYMDIPDEEDPIDFNYYQVLIKALVLDLFEGLYDEELNYKKLALIKAYYSLTKDKEILELLNRYSDNPLFWNYSSYIKGKSLNLVRTRK